MKIPANRGKVIAGSIGIRKIKSKLASDNNEYSLPLIEMRLSAMPEAFRNQINDPKMKEIRFFSLEEKSLPLSCVFSTDQMVV